MGKEKRPIIEHRPFGHKVLGEKIVDVPDAPAAEGSPSRATNVFNRDLAKILQPGERLEDLSDEELDERLSA